MRTEKFYVKIAGAIAVYERLQRGKWILLCHTDLKVCSRKRDDQRAESPCNRGTMIPKTLLTCWGVRFRAGPPRHLLQRQSALAQDQTFHAVDRPVPRAVYIHLPFCKKKCFYCDFPVKAVGMHPSSDGVSRHMEVRKDVFKDADVTYPIFNHADESVTYPL